MLIGTYRHSIDGKKRMRIPSKFKGELGTNCIITKGTGVNLMVFSAEGFDNLYEKLSNISIFDNEAQKPVRKFLSSAFEAEEDAQGRILLPKELALHALLKQKNLFLRHYFLPASYPKFPQPKSQHDFRHRQKQYSL